MSTRRVSVCTAASTPLTRTPPGAGRAWRRRTLPAWLRSCAPPTRASRRRNWRRCWRPRPRRAWLARRLAPPIGWCRLALPWLLQPRPHAPPRPPPPAEAAEAAPAAPPAQARRPRRVLPSLMAATPHRAAQATARASVWASVSARASATAPTARATATATLSSRRTACSLTSGPAAARAATCRCRRARAPTGCRPAASSRWHRWRIRQHPARVPLLRLQR